ncbi:aldo/keto reductase [Microbacterium limosum]|uniref:Aldo/keto reductase n=1 Tax=Microbacterium limosum TaxID=3079935 RepID=A0AAU0MIN7_9MICO|nr:aldo/keto reductase [Microbacterium sp. Y20]WOQ70014.1 aldo/keto reductase [Microbacterium sp. Y20]
MSIVATRVVIQSRLNSARLPAKAMLSVAGMPLVTLAARRAANTGLDVVVATSTESDDDPIVSAVTRAGIGVFRGSLSDTLDRFDRATRDLRPDDVVVRLTADNCLPDGKLAQALAAQVDDRTPYTYVGGDASPVPYGVSGEAFTVAVLRQAAASADHQYEREHVTPWIRERFRGRPLDVAHAAPQWAHTRATVDTLFDYTVIADLFEQIQHPVQIPWERLADLLADRRSDITQGLATPHLEAKGGQSALTLGGAQVGMQYGIANTTGTPTQRSALGIIEAGAEVGITHIDTAAAYGKSEQNIGAAFRRGLPRPMVAITKVRPLSDLPVTASVSHVGAAVHDSVMSSLVRLQAPSVETVLAHRWDDWARPGFKEALVSLQQEGIVQRIGVSLSTPVELFRALEDKTIGYVQLPFNLLDDRWNTSPVQAALSLRPDVVIATRSTFLQGLLIGGSQTRWPRNIGISRDALLSRIDQAVVDLGFANRTELALSYVLAHRWVSTIVVGADDPSHIYELASIAANPRSFSSDARAAVRRALPLLPPPATDPSQWEL